MPPPANLGAALAQVSPPRMPSPPSFPSVSEVNPAGQSFLDAPEVSAEFVADAEEVRPVWPVAPAPIAPVAAAAQPDPSPSFPPPLPRMSTPPAPPAEPQVSAPAGHSPFDALDELSISDAEEVDVGDVEVSVTDSDDAPSLDALAALTFVPSGGDVPPPPGAPRRKE